MNRLTRTGGIKRVRRGRGAWREDIHEGKNPTARVVNKILKKFPEFVAEQALTKRVPKDILFEDLFIDKVLEIEELFHNMFRSSKFTEWELTIQRRFIPYMFRIVVTITGGRLERRYFSYAYKRKRWYHFGGCPFLKPRVWFLENFDEIKREFAGVAKDIKGELRSTRVNRRRS